MTTPLLKKLSTEVVDLFGPIGTEHLRPKKRLNRKQKQPSGVFRWMNNRNRVCVCTPENHPLNGCFSLKLIKYGETDAQKNRCHTEGEILSEAGCLQPYERYFCRLKNPIEDVLRIARQRIVPDRRARAD